MSRERLLPAVKALSLTANNVNYYTEVVRDDLGEIIIPDSQGNMVRLIDLCWRLVKGDSILNACLAMGVHPLRFMALRQNHAIVDDSVRAAVELAGEADIDRATALMEGLTNANFDVNQAKAKFFIWRGKQRYYRLYGDKPQVSLNFSQANHHYNQFNISNSIRSLEENEKELTLEKNEFVCDD